MSEKPQADEFEDEEADEPVVGDGDVDLDQVTVDRYTTLLKSDAVSKAIYDQARFALQADKSKVAALQAFLCKEDGS